MDSGKITHTPLSPGTRLLFSTKNHYLLLLLPPLPINITALHYLKSPEDYSGQDAGRSRRNRMELPSKMSFPTPSGQVQYRKYRNFAIIPWSCTHITRIEIYLASEGGKTMQKRTRGGLFANVSFSFLCPLPSVCQNRGEKSDDLKFLKKIYIFSNY